MRVVLLPCSNLKREGGSDAPFSLLQGTMSRASWEALCSARGVIARVKGLPTGADLGIGAAPALPLLPAWERYNGNVYRGAQFTERDVRRADTRIVVVSALYGLIDIRDPIRKYDVQMTDPIAPRVTVHRLWFERGLPRVLAEVLRQLGANEVHDFLSGAYRKAVRGYDAHLPDGCRYSPRMYPSLGSGSNHHRGRDVRTLLDS